MEGGVDRTEGALGDKTRIQTPPTGVTDHELLIGWTKCFAVRECKIRGLKAEVFLVSNGI